MSHLKPNLPRSWYSLPKKEQQIDEKHELSESIYMSGHGLDRKDSDDIAEQLYYEGYRKQSDWISVDERLPQVTGKYICCVKDKCGNTWTVPADWNLEMKMWFGEFGEIKNMVTHWMPLPEPPKMKGVSHD